MVKLEMTFNDWKEMQEFFNNVGAARAIPGTVTVTPPAETTTFQPTEPSGVEKPKRGRKPKADTANPAGPSESPRSSDSASPKVEAQGPAVTGNAPAGPDITEAQRNELRDALKTFMTKHGLSAAEALLAKYGAKKMMDLKAEHFDNFKKDIQG